MSKTLTIRLPREQDAALTSRARVLGKTRSELVRELIDRGLAEAPLGRRIGYLKGQLDVHAPRAGWQRHLKERNWR